MKKWILILTWIGLSCNSGLVSKNKASGQLYVIFNDISENPDTVLVMNKLAIAILGEPSCTGCKKSLAEFFCDSLKDIPFMAVTIDRGSGTFNKRMYEQQIQHTFNCCIKTGYSLEKGASIHIYINNTALNIQPQGFPELVLVDPNISAGFCHFKYKDLFDGIDLRESKILEKLK